MNFASALFSLQRGHKIKRKHWGGYWFLKNKDIILHTYDGNEINFRDVKDLLYTLGNCACDDWEIADTYHVSKEESK